MTDLRGIPRGSKVAAVVVLVVLLQVIVVAIFGLGAITRDRKEGADRRREEETTQASGLADEVLARTVAGLRTALERAAPAAREPGGLSAVLRTGWAEAFRTLYLVDADGRIRAADGTQLYVPPEVVEREAASADARTLAARAAALGDAGGDATGILARHEFVHEFPFLVDDAHYAVSVGHAVRLVEDVVASPSSPVDLGKAVLLAYETASVNDGRPSAEHPGFAWVERRLQTIADGLPDEARLPLQRALDDLARARNGLRAVREYVQRPARDVAAAGGDPQVFPLSRTRDLVGVAPVPPAPRHQALLAVLDAQAVARLAADSAGATGGVDPRFRVRIVRAPTTERGDATVARRRLQQGSVDVDHWVEVVRTGLGAGPLTTGPRETFYWFILGLAALGVTTAGVVLGRILRREVHLARLKADFVSNLSHELKTPLTSISMFTEMLLDGQAANEAERREALSVVEDETERLKRIVGRMIDVARREAGSVAYDLVPGDVETPVRAACERFRRLERDPGLVLETRFAPGLPAIRLDAAAVDDAVTNLLSNAWKYRRGERAHVRVETRPVRGGVEVVVADDGIGIPRRERRRVFEMFYRAENLLSGSVPGTGLGLALVRTIVRGHRGRVDLRPTPGGGTTFVLRFPAARGVPPSADARATGSPAVSRSSPASVPDGAARPVREAHR